MLIRSLNWPLLNESIHYLTWFSWFCLSVWKRTLFHGESSSGRLCASTLEWKPWEMTQGLFKIFSSVFYHLDFYSSIIVSLISLKLSYLTLNPFYELSYLKNVLVWGSLKGTLNRWWEGNAYWCVMKQGSNNMQSDHRQI